MTFTTTRPRVRRALGVLLVAALGSLGSVGTLTTGVGLGAAHAAPASPQRHHHARTVSVAATGAVPNDGKDDLAAFERAISRARARGATVVVPAGTYDLGDVLQVQGVALRGAGVRKTVLVSTSTAHAALYVTGSHTTISNLTHLVPHPGARTSVLGPQNVLVGGAQHFHLAHLRLIGATGAGVMVRESTGGLVEHVAVSGTRADGIHLTDGTSEVTVAACHVGRVGDDGISVVSYASDIAPVHGIRVLGNTVTGNASRGLSVVGGQDVVLRGNQVTRSAMAGVYVSDEAEWNTRDTSAVRVVDNTITDCPTYAGGGHAAVLVYASQGAVSDIHFQHNAVVGGPNAGFGVWTRFLSHAVSHAVVGNLYYVGNSVTGTGGPATRFLAGREHLRDNRGF